MTKARVLIVDDHVVVIEGIKSILRDHPEFEVVGEAFDGRQAIKLAESSKPDIVIMDISMPDLNGIDATLQIKKLFPDIKIIAYTMHSHSEYVISLFKAGVSAFVLKNDPLSDLLLALSAVRKGGTYFSTMTPEILLQHMKELEEGKREQDEFESLSLREREVLQLLAEGKSVREIAEQLFISPKTVESHKYNIMAKLKIHRIPDLVKIAIRKNLISL